VELRDFNLNLENPMTEDRLPLAELLRALVPGEIDKRTGLGVTGEYANWTTHSNNLAKHLVTGNEPRT
jgi:hypothetical protein